MAYSVTDCIDIHVHSDPDLVPRACDDLTLIAEAQRHGMGGLVIKSHVFPTTDRAWLARKVTGFPVWGGIVLNHFVGGLNVDAVRTALELGAKFVWMPTSHAQRHLDFQQDLKQMRRLGSAVGGIQLDPKDEAQRDRLQAIWDLVAEHDAIMATGHLGPAEIAYLADLRPTPAARLLITHALSPISGLSLDLIAAMAARKNVWVELAAIDLTDTFEHPATIEDVLAVLRRIHPERIVLSSDAGQKGRPIAPDALSEFAGRLLGAGVSRENLELATIANPRLMLAL